MMNLLKKWEAIMRTLVFALLLTWSAAYAQGSWRVGNELILEGDTIVQVLAVAGPPDMRLQLENKYGATVGRRWYYRFEGYNARVVIITFRGGRVESIRTEYN